MATQDSFGEPIAIAATPGAESEQQDDKQRLVHLMAGWAQQPLKRTPGRWEFATTATHNDRFTQRSTC
jgi:hypothetical protein